jgi:hypothetical protein
MELNVDRAQDVRRARKVKASTVLYVEFGSDAKLIDAEVLDLVSPR